MILSFTEAKLQRRWCIDMWKIAFPNGFLARLLLSCCLWFGLLCGRHQTEAPSYASKHVLKSEGKQPEQPPGPWLT